MLVVGIDLSGPANPSETAAVAFTVGDSRLAYATHEDGADDSKLIEMVSAASNGGPVVVGLDAPLSYNPGGGDRQGDRELRRRLMDAGLKSGSVMPPTMTRMVYLTLRGVCVARAFDRMRPQPPRVVEVHPGGSMVLRGAPVDAVRTFKRDVEARRDLFDWLGTQGLQGTESLYAASDHLVAACACALAAWKWASGHSAWCHQAKLPLHPYDFAC